VRAVVDTSVVLAWLLADEPCHEQALAFRRILEEGAIDPVFAAPFPFEVRNGLVRAARQSRCRWERVPIEIGLLALYRPRTAPAPPDDVLLGLCRSFGLGWADAHWVHLAARTGLPLVTADKRVVQTVPFDVAWVEWLGDRPLGDQAAGRPE
jgi:predicted nucleic acid-binding protein